MAHPSIKPNILFYSNGPSIWHGFTDISQHIVMSIIVPYRSFFNLIQFHIFQDISLSEIFFLIVMV